MHHVYQRAENGNNALTTNCNVRNFSARTENNGLPANTRDLLLWCTGQQINTALVGRITTDCETGKYRCQPGGRISYSSGCNG